MSKQPVARGRGLEPLESRRLFAAAVHVYVTGNSLTDGISYGGFEDLLGRGGTAVTFGRQTGSGYTEYANYTLRPGYITSGVDPARPGVANPWGNYQQAFAGPTTWDDFTIQPNDRHLLKDVYNAGTADQHDEADVPTAELLLKAFAANNPTGQVFIYSRASRRTDVDADLTPTGLPFDYSTEWDKTYHESDVHAPAYFSRSYVRQFMPLIRQAQAADKATATLPPVRLIPVGEAYYNIDQDLKAGKFAGTAVTSSLDLYRDMSHPSPDVAAYVIALSFYASMTGTDPRGVAPPSAYLNAGSKLTDPKVVALLQQAVYDAMTNPAYAGYCTPLPGGPVVTPGTGAIDVAAFADANVNGTRDTGEAPLAGVQVYLDANGNGLFDAGEVAKPTAADGHAVFTGLPAGSYAVRVVTPAGDDVTAALPASTVSDGASTKSLIIGFAPHATNGGGTGGGTGTGTGGGIKAGTSTLTGYVVEDADRDRTWDVKEHAIPGRTVWVDLNNDGLLQDREPRTVTDAAGRWAFKQVASGTYYLREVIPAGFTQTLPTTNVGLGLYVAAGQVRGANFLGYTTGTPPPVPPTPVPPTPVPPKPTDGTGVFRGYVINDANKDGKWNSGELGLAGRTVWLDLDDNGVLDQNEPTRVTGVNGVFEFNKLVAGSYVVREVLPAGSVQATPTGNAGLRSKLAAGQTNSGQYFAVNSK